jgi:hypothetical protein
MIYNAAVFLRHRHHKTILLGVFSALAEACPELDKIKTKPIATQRVDIHTEEILKWVNKGLRPALERMNIYTGDSLHNIDEKGARCRSPAREEVIFPPYATEMYTGIP